MIHIANTKPCRNFSFILVILLLASVTRSLAQDASIFPKDGHFHDLNAVSLSPNNKILATADRWHSCILWDVSTGRQFQTIKDVTAVSFAGSNESICVVTKNGDVNMLNLSGTVIKKISEKKIKIVEREEIEFYPADGIFLSGTSVFDINKGLLFQLKEPGYGRPEAAYSPIRQQIAVINRADDTLNVYDIKSRNKVFSIKTEKQTYYKTKVVFSKDGKLLAMTGGSFLQVFDMNTKQTILTILNKDENSFIVRAAISPDGKTVVCWTRLKKQKP